MRTKPNTFQRIRIVSRNLPEFPTQRKSGDIRYHSKDSYRNCHLLRHSRERFKRLHGSICTRFGNAALHESAIEYLLKAMQFRGEVAHGHFIPIDEAEHRTFEKSIYAMEALCYLLTIRDLPMSEGGRQRAVKQQIVANYFQCPT